jgi:septal ring factor EnvC (AmiA/AmiB activator)
MTQQIDPDMSCSGPGCAAFRFDTDAALREGWMRVAGDTYCDLHAPYAAYAYVRAVRQEEQRAKKSDAEAKKTLNRRDYRAWDEFQSDLADFHKEHGRLAHERIRTMQPRDFLKIHAERGRINVQEAEDQLQEAENKAQATREWLMRR